MFGLQLRDHFGDCFITLRQFNQSFPDVNNKSICMGFATPHQNYYRARRLNARTHANCRLSIRGVKGSQALTT